MSKASEIDEPDRLERRRLLEFLDKYCNNRNLTLREAAEWFEDSSHRDEPCPCGP